MASFVPFVSKFYKLFGEDSARCQTTSGKGLRTLAEWDESNAMRRLFRGVQGLKKWTKMCWKDIFQLDTLILEQLIHAYTILYSITGWWLLPSQLIVNFFLLQVAASRRMEGYPLEITIFSPQLLLLVIQPCLWLSLYFISCTLSATTWGAWNGIPWWFVRHHHCATVCWLPCRHQIFRIFLGEGFGWLRWGDNFGPSMVLHWAPAGIGSVPRRDLWLSGTTLKLEPSLNVWA